MSKLFEQVLQHLKPGSGEGDKPDPLFWIRLVLAAILFALSLFLKMPTAAHIVLYAFSLIIAGYDLVIQAINSVEGKDFFASSLLICVVSVAAFFIGFAAEGVALVLVYQLGLRLIRYIDRRSRRSLEDMIRDEDEETQRRFLEKMVEHDAGDLSLTATVESSAGLVLKIAMVLALACVFLLPFLGDFSYRVSIHRALMILVVCTPMSVVAAMPLVGLTGMTFSAQQGVIFNKAAVMEDTAKANVAVFDKAGVFSEGEPRLISVQSEILDQRTFMNFAAHASYYSEQPFAHAVTAAYGPDYKLDVISDFSEIPGGGVELRIGGNPVVFATGAVCAERGLRVPQDAVEGGQSYFLVVAGRYAGRAVISDSVNEEARDLAEGIVESGIRRCILLTEEGNEESQQFGEALGFEEIYGECEGEKKLQKLREITQNGNNRTVYIYANGFEAHSDAAVDVRIGKKTKFADALVQPEDVSQLPFAVRICKRMIDMAKENAMLAFGVKAILIFLAMTGYSSIWFAMFADMAATVATQLNSIRVTQESLLASVKRR